MEHDPRRISRPSSRPRHRGSAADHRHHRDVRRAHLVDGRLQRVGAGAPERHTTGDRHHVPAALVRRALHPGRAAEGRRQAGRPRRRPPGDADERQRAPARRSRAVSERKPRRSRAGAAAGERGDPGQARQRARAHPSARQRGQLAPVRRSRQPVVRADAVPHAPHRRATLERHQRHRGGRGESRTRVAHPSRARRDRARPARRAGGGRDGPAAVALGQEAVGPLPLARAQLARPHHGRRRALHRALPESVVGPRARLPAARRGRDEAHRPAAPQRQGSRHHRLRRHLRPPGEDRGAHVPDAAPGRNLGDHAGHRAEPRRRRDGRRLRREHARRDRTRTDRRRARGRATRRSKRRA